MLRKIIPTLTIDIQNDYTSLNIRQRLIVEQRYYALSQLSQANDQLDGKAVNLLLASSLLFSLIGALRFPDIINSPLAWLGIALAFTTFSLMVYYAIAAWVPDDYGIPGTNDWEKIHSEYLHKDNDDSFTQVLDDCVEAYSQLKKVNERKAKKVRRAGYLFLVQIFGLFVAALSPGLISLYDHAINLF